MTFDAICKIEIMRRHFQHNPSPVTPLAEVCHPLATMVKATILWSYVGIIIEAILYPRSCRLMHRLEVEVCRRISDLLQPAEVVLVEY